MAIDAGVPGNSDTFGNEVERLQNTEEACTQRALNNTSMTIVHSKEAGIFVLLKVQDGDIGILHRYQRQGNENRTCCRRTKKKKKIRLERELNRIQLDFELN